MLTGRMTERFNRLLARARTFLWSDIPPWKTGLSAAIGAGIAVTPTIGVQTVLVLAIVSLVRGNRGIALIASGIANPWTIPFIYYLDFRVGAALMGQSAWAGLPGHFSRGTVSGALVPMLVGSAIVGLACGFIIGTGVAVLCRFRQRIVRRRRVPA
jgi:uncharacterized protein (DUF2062 family)